MTGPTAEPETGTGRQQEGDGPLISVLLDATGADASATRRTWRALVAQDDDAWELLVCGTLVPALQKDSRATVVDAPSDDPGERADALLAAASGGLVAVVDPGAEPAAHAIGALSGHARRSPEASVILTDEVVERWDRPGIELRRKPAWSPEHLRNRCYPGRLTAVRRELVAELGGYRAGFDGAHEHDLLLRVSERQPEVVRRPRAAAPQRPAGPTRPLTRRWGAATSAPSRHTWTAAATARPRHRGRSPGPSRSPARSRPAPPSRS